MAEAPVTVDTALSGLDLAVDPVGGSPRHGRNLLALLGSQVATWSLVMVWTFVVPRRLGPSAWGMLVTGSGVAGILAVLMGLGTRNFLVREMVRAPRRIGDLLASAIVIRLAFLVPGTLLLVAYLQTVQVGSTQVFVIYLAVAVVFMALLREPCQAIFQSAERMEFLAATDVTEKVGQATGAIVLVLLGYGVLAVAGWAVAVSVVVLTANLMWARRFTRLSLATDVARVRQMLAGSLPYWATGLFLTFYVWIDTVMLSLMAPVAVVGYYGVPTRLMGTLLFGATIVSTAWLPRFVVAHEQGMARLREVARVPIEQVLVLGLPVTIGAAAVAAPLIRTLYGPAYEGAVPVMAVLALCALPLYLNVVANQLLVASGRQAVWTRVMIAASVVNPVINLFAIRYFQQRTGNGAIGAAASLLLTEALIAGFCLLFVTRGVFDRGSAVRLSKALVAAVVMAALVYLARRLGLVPQVAIGIVSFGALALLLRVPTRSELDQGKTAIAKLRSRLWR